MGIFTQSYFAGMNFQSDWDIRLFNKGVSEVIAEWKERDDQGSARDVFMEVNRSVKQIKVYTKICGEITKILIIRCW